MHILHWVESDKTQVEWENTFIANQFTNFTVSKYYREMSLIKVVQGSMRVENGTVCEWKEENQTLTPSATTLSAFLSDWVYVLTYEYANFHLTQGDEFTSDQGGYYEIADKYITCGDKTCQWLSVRFDERGRLQEIRAYGFLSANTNKTFDVQYYFNYPDSEM